VNTWKVIFATMVIFGAGVVTGALLVKHSGRAQPVHATRTGLGVRPFQTNSPGGMRTEFLRRAERELDLNPQQRERIDNIIVASQDRSRKLMEPVSPLLREELKRTKEEFRAVLSPEQQTRFDEMLKQEKHPRDQRHSQPQRDRQPENSGTIEGAPKHP
jgi:Spy/CpxP family protein refolding chaperone